MPINRSELLNAIYSKTLSLSSRALRWMKSHLGYEKKQRFDVVAKWLASDPRIIPSKASSLEICESIEHEVIQKISNKDLAQMLFGLIQYKRSGLTPSQSHYAFIRSYEHTNGLAQELFHHALFHQPSSRSSISSHSYFFPDFSSDDLKNYLNQLKNSGYCALGEGLSLDHVNEIEKRLSRMRFSPRGLNKWNYLDPNSPPACNVADANQSDLKEDAFIASFLADPILLEIASAYLQSNAELQDYSAWYTFPAASASANAAQLFHYDLDTLRWLKVFVFLSDVTAETGPHEYIEGSHRPGSKPSELLQGNYARIDDSKIDEFYHGQRKKLILKRGSVVLADTRCFHKGINPVSGFRLVLQPIYSPSKLSFHHC